MYVIINKRHNLFIQITVVPCKEPYVYYNKLLNKLYVYYIDNSKGEIISENPFWNLTFKLVFNKKQNQFQYFKLILPTKIMILLNFFKDYPYFLVSN